VVSGQDQTREREAKMKAWLASLPGEEREQFEASVLGRPHRTQDEIAQQLGEALKQLPEAQRVAVFLCDFGGLSYIEAAKQLHIPAGEVRRHVEQGRAQLSLLLPRELMEDAARLSSSEDHGAQG
jgi:DNA-directed RNA polymerase specialized sigma24 family protein